MPHQRPPSASASAPATLARRGRDGAAHARRRSTASHRHRHHRSSRAQPAGLPAAPAWRCSRTRRSSAPTRSRTSRASTRTACSSTSRPTRSCVAGDGRRDARRCSCSASTRAATRFASRLDELGYPLDGEAARAAFSRFKVLADKKVHHRRRSRGARAATRAREPRDVHARRAPGRAAARSACRPRPCGCAIRDGDDPRARRDRHRSGRRGLSRRSTRSSRRRRAARVLASHAVTEGIDALGEVTRARDASDRSGPASSTAHGADTDIIVASAQAYLRALNRIAGRASHEDSDRERRWQSGRRHHDGAARCSRRSGTRTSSPKDAGGPAVLYIDLHLVHEVTSPQAFDGLRLARPARCAAPTARSRPWTTTSRRSAASAGVVDAALGARSSRRSSATAPSSASRSTRCAVDRQGIVHVIGPELGLTQPGMTIVCGDSHTSTHGAFGALAFGIGTSEVEHVLATQCCSSAAEDDAQCARRRARRRASAPRTSSSALIGRDRHRRRHRATSSSTRGAAIRALVDGGPHDGLQHVDRGRRARRA